MKGDAKVIEELNARLAEELTAINQYFVHAEMCEDWHYGRLAEAIKKRSITEMKHAEKLIARIIFLDGRPTVSKLNKFTIGADVATQHKNDLVFELDAVKSYNMGIKLAAEAGDNGTRDLLTDILKDEEDHVDVLEMELDQIKQMGIQNYLGEQIG
jgi:bacterioferritin